MAVVTREHRERAAHRVRCSDPEADVLPAKWQAWVETGEASNSSVFGPGVDRAAEFAQWDADAEERGRADERADVMGEGADMVTSLRNNLEQYAAGTVLMFLLRLEKAQHVGARLKPRLTPKETE